MTSSEIFVIDSRLKSSGTNQNANYSLLNMGGIGLQGGATYEMMSFHSVNQVYNVEVGVNDKIYFDEGGGLLTATIAPGYYSTATAMLTAVVASLDAAGGVTYGTSAYDAVLGLYTITPSAGTMGFLFASNTTATARKLLGKDAVDDALGASQLSDFVVDQLLHTNLFVTIVQEGSKHVTIIPGTEFSLMVPLNSVFGEHIHHRKQEHYSQTIEFSTNISIIDVQLYTEDGVALVNTPDYLMTLRRIF